MNRQYKYDAFISYRHADLDKFVAETIHREMENYKAPGNIWKKTNGRKKIERVFRDQEELPLSSNLEDHIKDALQQSEYLIVICTPRLKESEWCQKEIDTFIEMHGRKNIFVVLAEGEPDDVFPEQLCHGKEIITHEDGTKEEVEGHWEPLAADVRGKDKKAVKKAIKSEILRLLAPMFGVDYDDLRQRHRERTMKKVFRRTLLVAGVSLMFGVVSTSMAINIAIQKNHIKHQNEEIKAQSSEIVSKNLEIKKQNDLLAEKQGILLAERAQRNLKDGDRMAALQDAYSALTTYEGNQMPYLPKAQEILTEALHVYDIGSIYWPSYRMEVEGILEVAKPSTEGTYLALSDNGNRLYIYHMEDGQLLNSIDDIADYSEGQDKFVFVDDDKIVFIAGNRNVYMYSASEGKNKKIDDVADAYVLYRDPDGKSFWVSQSGSLVKINVDTLATEQVIQTNSTLLTTKILGYGTNNDKLIYTVAESGTANNSIVCRDIKSGQENRIPCPELTNSVSCFNDCLFVINVDTTGRIDEWVNYVSCYDENTFELKWTLELEYGYAEKVYQAPEGTDDTLALLETSGYLYTIRWETGEIVKMVPEQSSIIRIYRVQGRYLMFDRSGKMLFYRLADNAFTEASFYDLEGANIRETFAAMGGFVAAPYDENYVVVCRRFNTESPERYEGELPQAESTFYNAAEIDELVEKYGFERKDWILGIMLIEEDNKAIVTYRDGKTMIYDTQTHEIYNEIAESFGRLNYYYGQDKNGNIYIAESGDGYVLNSQYELIAKIDGLKALLPEENKVVVECRGIEATCLPIYTLEELLAMAKEIVLE